MPVVTVSERPDLVEPGWGATKDVIPEYNNHGDVLNRYWGGLTEERAEFQFYFVDGPYQPRSKVTLNPSLCVSRANARRSGPVLSP